ncbi:hypothetical protein CC1G_13081 [Coprinopsis cinerea okayama7|uniref:PLC-like phosphodiesterase n=1 Tax=Coprinopsis cinerea (strain Okayama-7 / 130 / ATCC MYA-4618 / FGSC 9003) TaxID=240176 RepID=A8NME0_COPC7|nr:hypothetical protein CC1G_13081 [Coprinopsis cinerea okayama7\|eukprot:XP_001834897.2 hypothetical protein CC1G_13081 [Coprinopsis cinerea okayama7\
MFLLVVTSTYLFISAASTYASWQSGVFPADVGMKRQIEAQTSFLQASALQDILRRGTPLLGTNEGCPHSSPTCDWMSRFPDDTQLVHMNFPGVHDAATGSYTDEIREDLLRYTGPIPPANVYRCQERSLFQMLNDGIRMFDMRIAYNPGNDTIGFWHSRALLAPTTTLNDVLYGFYSWLDQHPTETVLMSFKHEGGTGTPKDEKLQRKFLDAFSRATDQDPGPLKRRYWVQSRGELGTLGEARGKLILLQRFDYDLLNPTPPDNQLIGIDLGPTKWTDNGRDIELVYNAETGATAFIQDYYSVTPFPASPDPASKLDSYVSSKFETTIAHLERAANEHSDQLFINFASAAYLSDSDGPIIHPVEYALGNSTLGVSGMNQRLLPWLQERRGRRFGVILYDFYDAVPGLIEATIGLGA